jgi:response regulator NasT
MRAISRTTVLGGDPPRWRVAILDGDVPSRTLLRTAVEEAGGVVAVEAPLRLDAVELMKQTRPDVVIMAPSLAGMREPALMPRITAGLDCPAVLLTRDTEPAVVRQANRAGVMAFMLKPLRAAELAPTLDLALARFRDLRRLQQARSDRPFVDRAKSKLMSDGRLSEDEAFRWLRRRAMDSRQRLGDVAREVLAREAALETMEAGVH